MLQRWKPVRHLMPGAVGSFRSGRDLAYQAAPARASRRFAACSLEGRAAPALASIDRNGRVIHIGSYSKTISPALRLGFLVAPLPLASRFAEVAACLAPAPGPSVQLATAEFMREGHYMRHLRRAKRLYSAQRDALLKCLRPRAKDSVVGGLAVVLRLPDGAPDVSIAKETLTFGLAPDSPVALVCFEGFGAIRSAARHRDGATKASRRILRPSLRDHRSLHMTVQEPPRLLQIAAARACGPIEWAASRLAVSGSAPRRSGGSAPPIAGRCKARSAFIMSMMPWIASSPPTPRIAAPRISWRLGIDDDLHEALRLAFLDRAPDAASSVAWHRAGRARSRGASVSVMPTRPSGGSMYSA